MKPIREALAAVMQKATLTGVERVGLDACQGRVCAGDVFARFDSPPFDNSAMDGYALRAVDVPAPGVTLPVVGESRAGGPAPRPLARGSAMRIYTGAAMPEDADTVVIQEDVARDGDQVRFSEAARVDRHVRARGSDLIAGQVAVPGGTLLGAGEVALLASQDYASVEVACRPRVAILSTGDELRDVGAPPAAGSIVNSNGYMLACQVREAGGEPWVLPPARDVEAQVADRIEQGLAADVLLLSGGVSVGDYDVVRAAAARAGVALEFDKVAMKPGKPLTFGTRGTTPVLGLPGNPVSAFVSFELFVRPLLRHMQGDNRPYRARLPVHLTTPHQHRTGRLELARASLSPGDAGWQATLLGRQGSGALSALVGVDALVLLPSAQPSFGPEEALWALCLGGPGSDQPPFDGVD